tara:strand:- start:935 stop:1441 length:507 start_codon:yes stop_codon:yes gene_type:complete
MQTRIPSLSTDLLNSTAGVDTSPFWNPGGMESKWGIPNPASSAPTGGNMAFPWMAAATIGSAGLNFLGQRGAARSQAAAGGEAMKFQKNLFEAQQESGADLLAAQFGMGQKAADTDYGRQVRGSIQSLNLMNSAPYINNLTREAGFNLAGRGFGPDQVARFTQMFGGA